jgi:DNA-binding transcriptional regulator LsrR (DeoR family)
MPRKQRFENKGAGKGVKHQLDRATLSYLYVDEGLSQAEIARRYGCTRQFISLLLAEHSIVRPGSPH